MINRIPDRLRSRIRDISGNELIVIPAEGEFGFEDYLEEKAAYFVRKKKLHGDVRKHQLLLSYPGPDADISVFNRFFDSAEVVSGGAEFQGIFAIDVTDYVEAASDLHFQRLMGYINDLRGAQFVLFIFEKNTSRAYSFYAELKNYGLFEMELLEYPSQEAMTEYLTTRLEEYYSEAMPDAVVEHIRVLFRSEKAEYDYAEKLLNELILNECPCDEDSISKALSSAVDYFSSRKKNTGRPQLGFL